jgi:hypothetical protein
MMRNSANPAPDDGGDVSDGIGNVPLLISLMPFVLLVVLYVFPIYGAGTGGGQSGFDILSFGAGLVFVFIALLWGALGIYLVSESDSYGKAIGVLLFVTLPSSLVVVMAPWFGS